LLDLSIKTILMRINNEEVKTRKLHSKISPLKVLKRVRWIKIISTIFISINEPILCKSIELESWSVEF